MSVVGHPSGGIEQQLIQKSVFQGWGLGWGHQLGSCQLIEAIQNHRLGEIPRE